MLTNELEQTRNMLQHLQDSLVQDDGSQLKVVHFVMCISLNKGAYTCLDYKPGVLTHINASSVGLN